ncbi:CREB-regulated transcription coactivator 1 like protein [Ditylenchus destructor]|nr:CREB-regulated transcription coactivator 1 like protein [Ditylenchus destructor]
MSQGTPRKFSEKIAILERKQNEEQEQFHSVMRDVRAITSHKTPPRVCSPSTLSAANHPLAMAWNRPGGSLPNVHQMVQQQQQQPVGDYSTWNYWQMPNAGQGHVRTRSPGSHYHPYMNRPKQNERIPPLHGNPLDGNMMSPSVHLQPPDSSWSKARSDPTIHMNAIAAATAASAHNAYPYHQPTMAGGGQWSPDPYRTMNGGCGAGSPSSAPTSAHVTSFVPTYPAAMQFALNVQQFGNGQAPMMPSSVPNNHQQLQQHQSLGSPGGCQQLSGNPGLDGSVGSLPNMHASLMQQHSQQFGNQSQAQHQQMQNNSCAGQQSQIQNSFLQHRLSTPGGDCSGGGQMASQSAPTSPADQRMEKDVLLRGQQWTPTPQSRHYSASPDTFDMNSIPNIVLTGADGTLDCFQDLQDLHLDNEIQQMLSNPNEQVDPALETQLLN